MELVVDCLSLINAFTTLDCFSTYLSGAIHQHHLIFRVISLANVSLINSHVTLKAATTLGFPCKHAVIGFEKKGGGRVTVPMMQGCICKTEHEQAVRDAAICLQEAREERGEESDSNLTTLPQAPYWPY